MLTHHQLRHVIERCISDLGEQGHVVEGLAEELAALPDSYDGLVELAGRLGSVPLRDDWPYVEPDELDAIRAECDPAREVGRLVSIEPEEAEPIIRDAFLARVCGCMLGKPFEVFVTLDEIRTALEPHGEWPLRDYPTEAAVRALPRLQGQWAELVRGRISHVAPDDDINYTILAMLVLEAKGRAFTHNDLRQMWSLMLPAGVTFGPERTRIVQMGLSSLVEGDHADGPLAWLNPGAELCGALIRADAYGYACLGHPELAAELAHRDASFTHRRTGVYGAMFVAAAIACAPFAETPLDIFRTAVAYVPQRSRFAEAVRASLLEVEAASDWLDGYGRVRSMFGEYGFCRIIQEIGTVINTLRFAQDTNDGICIQVMQGNDTDSFGATAGSILGARYAGRLDPGWWEVFQDEVHTALALFHEPSLSKITRRMAQLPRRIAGDMT